MKRHLFCAALFLLAAACVCLPPGRQMKTPAGSSAEDALLRREKSVRHALPDADETDELLLFPGLDADMVTAVSIAAEGRSFEFLRHGQHDVRVNGSRADSEIFRTLVSQIAAIPVTPAEPSPDGQQPLLHLTVSAGGKQYQAAFFADGAGPFARVRAGHSGWHLTDGWRAGTLLLTCEGARIEDAP